MPFFAPDTQREPEPQAAAQTVAEVLQTQRLILLAEDNEINREVMQEQLRLLGFACELAEDGAIALQMWQADPGRYALLLSDCHMPHLDGFGLTAAIRSQEPTGTHLPIIAVTANAMHGEAERCRERGMDDYLSKPLRMHELAPMLEKWLPQAVAPILPVWNPVTLTELLGDNPGLHRRLLEKFLGSAENQVAEIMAAVTAKDATALAGVAHPLKSAARSVGALALGALCQNIETAADQAESWPAIALLAQPLGAVFAAAGKEINIYLAAA
jgi:CheY-like chemotaxis protein/HPt (histidine-containing phosphotransfer) domain-containing protein